MKQVTRTVTTAMNLIEQLMAVEVTAAEVWFLLCSELLVPKMNKIAFEIWEKLLDKLIDETNENMHKIYRHYFP